jgi:HEAT repeat protein
VKKEVRSQKSEVRILWGRHSCLRPAFKPACSLVLIALTAFAQTADVKTRQRAVRDLARGGQDSIIQIAPYVKDPDLSVRIEAVKVLVEIGGPKTVDPLVTATTDNDPEIQLRATDGLVNVYLPGYYKSGISGSISRAGNSVRAKFGETNEQVIDAFVEVKPEVINALARLATGGSSIEGRANACRALGVLRGQAAVPALADALHSKDNAVMLESLVAIQKIRDPAAGQKVEFLLKDLDDRIQIAAIEATGILRNQRAAPDVRDVVEHARTPKIRRAAVTSLAMLAEPADHPVFLRYLSDKDDNLRCAAYEGLARVKNPVDRETLEKAFTNERSLNPWLSAAFALVSLGNLDNTDFAPLRYLVNTLNVKSNRQAANALLTELTRDAKVRSAIYPLLTRATKDEKIQLAVILSRSGGRDSLPYLETLSVDPDADVAQEGLRSLRSLRARLP